MVLENVPETEPLWQRRSDDDAQPLRTVTKDPGGARTSSLGPWDHSVIDQLTLIAWSEQPRRREKHNRQIPAPLEKLGQDAGAQAENTEYRCQT